MSRLSPINRRRFDRFKANRRGWWSLWLFSGLLALCLCAELIANDKPLLISYEGELYFPVFRHYWKPASAESPSSRTTAANTCAGSSKATAAGCCSRPSLSATTR